MFAEQALKPQHPTATTGGISVVKMRAAGLFPSFCLPPLPHGRLTRAECLCKPEWISADIFLPANLLHCMAHGRRPGYIHMMRICLSAQSA
mmetsp:Transcript_21842/g.42575  ORF Transcript_21842/g.42575 Transcript_21842/m.42575 type:complete len:91 (+) Transcript_21842:128-400(+)